MDKKLTFGQKLVHLVAGNAEGNFAISTLSVRWVLLQLALGARGSTRIAMLEALDLESAATDDQILGEIGIYQALTSDTWSIEAAVFAQKGYAILASFQAFMEKLGGFGLLDFAQDSQGAVDTINAWAAKATAGLIKQVLEYGMLKRDVKVVVVQAIRFVDRWMYQFYDAGQKLFYVDNAHPVNAKTIKLKANLKGGTTKHFRTLAIPYKDGKSHFVIMLPDKATSLESTVWFSEEMLDAARVVTYGEEAMTDLSMPEGNISWGTTDLISALGLMGFAQAASFAANFSGITGDFALYLSNVFHYCVVKWDKEGTQAAAVTVGVTRSKSVSLPRYFDVDKSFYWLIVKDGKIGFCGRLLNPTQH